MPPPVNTNLQPVSSPEHHGTLEIRGMAESTQQYLLIHVFQRLSHGGTHLVVSTKLSISGRKH